MVRIRAIRSWFFCILSVVGSAGALVRAENRLDWWSFRPLTQPDVPDPDAGWVRTPIDAFILATLTEKNLTPSPEADRRTLIRRLTFDLIGLPPTPAETQAFLTDTAPDAYERLVDRLLDSPHYGERWGRHWLDVVHYGDTHGYDKDKPRPNAWPYRDYVIRSFNQDKPYTRFVREQLAGDVLFPGDPDGIEATGFIAAGPWDFIGHAEVPETKLDGRVARNLDRDDMVATAMNTFVSMTVQCARCHDHKFDPVTMEDYYSLQAVFAALDRADRHYDIDAEVARQRAELTQRQDDLKARHKAIVQRVIDAALREETETVERSLKDVSEKIARLPKQRVVYAGTVHTGKDAFRGTGPDGGKPRTIHVLNRGDLRSPGKEVGPGTVNIIPGAASRFIFPENHPEGRRRAALADWIVDRRNPLTWRSIVNRVWLYHFGRGIVDTPGDLGHMGQLPTHPKLLDWLAAEFRDGGQSLKALHRLIVTSSVYRQASAGNAHAEKIDAGNQNLWRMNRRRLDAESIRDAVLAISGKLDPRMFGPAFQDFVIENPEHSPHYQYHLHDPDDPKTHRRAIYRFLVRSQPQPFMQTLDCADPSEFVAKRGETLTALQALALLNNRFMVRMSQHLADRLRTDHDDRWSQLEAAFQWTIHRSPTTEELESLTAYANEFGLPNTCRVILNLNEFVFVD